jgi:hypothetical protein
MVLSTPGDSNIVQPLHSKNSIKFVEDLKPVSVITSCRTGAGDSAVLVVES